MLEHPEHIRKFVEAILHGDDEHRDWLKEAGECFINEQPLPATRGGGKTIDPAQMGFVKVVDVEKALLTKLGRKWTATGISIQSLIDELANGKSKVDDLIWSEPQPPNDYCRYDHCTAKTPFGTYSIEWKGWKKHDAKTVFFHPMETQIVANDGGELADAQAKAQEHFNNLSRAVCSTQKSENPKHKIPSPDYDAARAALMANDKQTGMLISTHLLHKVVDAACKIDTLQLVGYLWQDQVSENGWLDDPTFVSVEYAEDTLSRESPTFTVQPVYLVKDKFNAKFERTLKACKNALDHIPKGPTELEAQELVEWCLTNNIFELDDHPDADATDAAHPAWWRGHEHTTETFCREVNAILDGFTSGGVANEPWHSLRRRLFDIKRDLNLVDAILPIAREFPMGRGLKVEYDGFNGKVIGWYRRDDEKPGVVGQYYGTKMCHVYGAERVAK